LQDGSQYFAVLGFCASAMRCRELLERQSDVFFNITDNKIGGHDKSPKM